MYFRAAKDPIASYIVLHFVLSTSTCKMLI